MHSKSRSNLAAKFIAVKIAIMRAKFMPERKKKSESHKVKFEPKLQASQANLNLAN